MCMRESEGHHFEHLLNKKYLFGATICHTTQCSMLFSVRDRQIYITGAIFCLPPNSDLAQKCSLHAVSLRYMQNEFTHIQRQYFV